MGIDLILLPQFTTEIKSLANVHLLIFSLILSSIWVTWIIIHLLRFIGSRHSKHVEYFDKRWFAWVLHVGDTNKNHMPLKNAIRLSFCHKKQNFNRIKLNKPENRIQYMNFEIISLIQWEWLNQCYENICKTSVPISNIVILWCKTSNKWLQNVCIDFVNSKIEAHFDL